MNINIKIIFGLFAVFLLINAGFSFYLYKQNSELQSDVSAITGQLYKLDLEALENIKSKPKEFNAQEDCGSGMWQLPCE